MSKDGFQKTNKTKDNNNKVMKLIWYATRLSTLSLTTRNKTI
jgi:hypothetical protein